MKEKLKTINLDGVKLDIFVGEDGDFSAVWQGARVTAPSLKALTEKLRKSVRARGRIAVPATLIEDAWREDTATVIHITLVGAHAGNHHPLYKEDGANDIEQLRWGSERVYRRLTDQEITQFHALRRAITEAEERLAEWKDARRVDAKTLMAEAQEALHATLETSAAPPTV